MKAIAVGKNSFLAKSFEGHYGGGFIFLSHDEALKDIHFIKDADIVLNFAYDPALKDSAYDPDHDIDLALASALSPQAHYCMLSSRMVYGDAPNILLREGDECKPINNYGRAKLETERALSEMLGERLTILRLANIFGFEIGRKTFMGAALQSLKENGMMSFNIAPDSVRDFLPVEDFASTLSRIVARKTPGVFNLGSGLGVKCQDIASWLIEGYGQGEIVYTATSTEGQFVLDMDRTREVFGLLPLTLERIKEACLRCGASLRLS